MTSAAIIIAVLSAAYFNTTTPDIQAECSHATPKEMVACVIDAENRGADTICTDDTDCAAKFGGEY